MSYYIMIELIKIVKSKLPTKKWTAHFKIDGKPKIVNFGYNSTTDKKNDFTLHNNEDRKRLYLLRHKKDLNTNQPYMAGYLSIFILWNLKSRQESIEKYKELLNEYNKTNDINVFKNYYNSML